MALESTLKEELTARLGRNYLPPDLFVSETSEITWNSEDRDLAYVW